MKIRIALSGAVMAGFLFATAQAASAHAGTATCLTSGLTRISNNDPHSGVVTLNDGRHLTLPSSGHVDFVAPPATTFSIVWSDQFSQTARPLPEGCHPPTTTTVPATTTTVKATTTTHEVTTSTTVPGSTSLVTSTTVSGSSVPSTTADPTTTSASSSTLPATSSIQPLPTIGTAVSVAAPETAVLPVTGFPAGLVAVVAVVALVAGLVIVVSARRSGGRSS